jgi:hypothetical protein
MPLPIYIREYKNPEVFGISIETVKKWDIPVFKPSPRIKLYPIEAIKERIGMVEVKSGPVRPYVFRRGIVGRELREVS